MKTFIRHITSALLMLFTLSGMSSCIFDNEYTDVLSEADPDKAFLVLHVSPINTTRVQDNGDVTEKIESLRIIMLNEIDGKTTIEVNGRTKLDMEDFPYSFTHKTVQGKKKFYFIANEDRVTNIISPSQTEADKNKTLRELLDAYEAGVDATAFETWINSVYFEPTYNINEKKEIYLPYTAFYEGTEVKQTSDGKWENLTQPEMYLVPVATKFFFRFYNYHQYPVEIKNLSIKSIAPQNFLLANVDEEDQTKDFDGVQMYWVDWLAKVAEKTQDGQLDNEEINSRYGWISAYQLPETNDHKEKVLISEDNVETIRVSTDSEKAPLYLGPYYLPESRNYDESNTTHEEQDYLLHLHLHDTEVNSSTSNDFDDELRIGNVKALFRDTYVLITVTMKNGTVEAYGQIEGWGHSVVEGWAGGGNLM